MKKYIVSIVACIVLIGALGGLYMLNRSRQTPEEAPVETNAQIPLLDRVKSDAKTLEIVRAEDTVTYQRGEDGTWQMSDVDAPLEQALVTDIADYISALYALEKVEDATEDLSGYGLAPAVATLTVTYANGTAETVRLGARTPARDYYYMMVDGDPSLYLISNTSGARFSRTRNDMLNRTMLAVQTDALLHILIAKNGETMLEAFANESLYNPETQANRLFTVEPVFGREIYVNMFQAKVPDILAAVTLGACVAEATPENLTEYGFDAPMYDITMENRENSYRLIVGKAFGEANEKAYAMYAGIPYIFEIMSGPIMAVSNLTAFDFIDKFVSLYMLDYVDNITIDSFDLNRRYEMEIAHKHVEAVGQQIAEHDEVTAHIDGLFVPENSFRDMYTAIMLITYDETVAEFTPNSDEPVLSVAFTFNDGTEKVVDTYYDYDSAFYIIDKGSQGVFLVNKAYVKTMLDAVEETKVNAAE